MIGFRAPGKAVIWGEYAVLEGAPALVMAVNRYASAAIEIEGDRWRCEAHGFSGNDQITARELLAGSVEKSRGAAVLAAAVAAVQPKRLPPGARLVTDTSTFYHRGIKLGIGSSAAICTATYAALAELVGAEARYPQALAAHRHLQGSAGSGLDVAAAWHGGLIRFQQGTAASFGWPAALSYRFIWTGRAAKTTDHLARFAAWRDGRTPKALSALCQASERLFTESNLEALGNYVDTLKHMDKIANLGIYSDAHRALDSLALALANEAQVVYKPCGAGGGDIGIAISDNQNALQAFVEQATKLKYQILPLEIADHGIHRTGR